MNDDVAPQTSYYFVRVTQVAHFLDIPVCFFREDSSMSARMLGGMESQTALKLYPDVLPLRALPLVSGAELALAHEMGAGGGGGGGGEGTGAGGALEAFAVADMDAMLRQLRLWASVAVAVGRALAVILLDLPGNVGSGTGIDSGGGIGVVTGMGGRRVGSLIAGAALAALTAAAAASTDELLQLKLWASALLPAP